VQPDFVKFDKIPRLYRPIVVTEKIDGTNAQVYVPEDPNEPVLAGSRNRWLTVESDNFGFAAWVAEHEDELRQLGPGRHFGEWWGRGIQRNYGLSERRFSLFNVSKWLGVAESAGDAWRCSGSDMAAFPLGTCSSAPACCHTVPVIGVFPVFDRVIVDDCIHHLRTHGSFAAPGFKQPEGIVIFHTASGHLFKVTLENDEAPKGQRGL
jgi:hypothetical protein